MDNDQITIELLREILKWTRFEGIQKARDTLETLLKTDIEKIIYQNSDGRTSREIAQLVGTSHPTVIRHWKRWSVYGIVEEVRSRGGSRYKRVFSLPDFGIEVPQTERRADSSENNERIDQSAELGGEQ
jgi:DNA-binding MarR family transcriptional regulator